MTAVCILRSFWVAAKIGVANAHMPDLGCTLLTAFLGTAAWLPSVEASRAQKYVEADGLKRIGHRWHSNCRANGAARSSARAATLGVRHGGSREGHRIRGALPSRTRPPWQTGAKPLVRG